MCMSVCLNVVHGLFCSNYHLLQCQSRINCLKWKHIIVNCCHNKRVYRSFNKVHLMISHIVLMYHIRYFYMPNSRTKYQSVYNVHDAKCPFRVQDNDVQDVCPTCVHDFNSIYSVSSLSLVNPNLWC